MNFYIWDKVSNINDATAEYMLEDNPKRITDDVIVFTTEQGVPYQTACVSDLKSTYNIDQSLSAEEVAKAYLEIKEKENQPKEDKPTEEQEKIQELEKIIDEQDAKLIDAECELALVKASNQ